MPTPLNNSLVFLISTLFDLYLFILIIRLVLVWIHADYYSPATQVIIKLTQNLITPLRRVLPNFKRIETSTVAVILVLEIIKFFLITSLSMGMPHLSGLVILAIADTLKSLVNCFFYAILLQAVLSWVQPYSPLNQLLSQITSPLIRPIRRVMPPVANFDLSPIPAMIGLQLIILLFVNPLMTLGIGMLVR